MKVTIDQVLAKRNKSVYWLSQKLNCDFQNLQKLCENKTTKVSFELLENVCIVLNCTPNDILKIED